MIDTSLGDEENDIKKLSIVEYWRCYDLEDFLKTKLFRGTII